MTKNELVVFGSANIKFNCINACGYARFDGSNSVFFCEAGSAPMPYYTHPQPSKCEARVLFIW
jgi:hypothetical protein